MLGDGRPIDRQFQIRICMNPICLRAASRRVPPRLLAADLVGVVVSVANNPAYVAVCVVGGEGRGICLREAGNENYNPCMLCEPWSNPDREVSAERFRSKRPRR